MSERDRALADAMEACGRERTNKPWAAHVAYDECINAIARLRGIPAGDTWGAGYRQAIAEARSVMQHEPSKLTSWLELRLSAYKDEP